MLGFEIVSRGDVEAIGMFRDYPARTSRAMVRALNRGIKASKTLMGSLIAKELKLKVGRVKVAMPLQEATLGRHVARFRASLRPIPLIAFNARGRYPSMGRPPGVTARGQRYPRAFIAYGKGGKRHVFERVGRSRLPIKRLVGPSIGETFQKHRAAATARGREVFDRTLAHELAWRSRRA